jgi:hypothetical protein
VGPQYRAISKMLLLQPQGAEESRQALLGCFITQAFNHNSIPRVEHLHELLQVLPALSILSLAQHSAEMSRSMCWGCGEWFKGSWNMGCQSTAEDSPH